MKRRSRTQRRRYRALVLGRGLRWRGRGRKRALHLRNGAALVWRFEETPRFEEMP